MSDADLPRGVVYSEAIRNRLKSLADEAKQKGKLNAFRQALMDVQKNLESRLLPPTDDPTVFGEPCFRLHNLDMLVCLAVIPPIAMRFAVTLHAQSIGEQSFIGVYVLSISFIG